MKEIVEYIARAIVNAPDEVKVTEETDAGGIVIKLEVNAEDKGRVIGKQGRTAKAMRTILSAASTKIRKRTVLEIIE